MAALLFRGKKGAALSCAPPSSTATSTGTYHQISDDRQGARELGRCTPHLRREQAPNWVPPSLSKNKTHLHKSSRSSEKPSDLASPAASTRYLLGGDEDDAFFDVFQELDPLPAWIPIDPARFHSVSGDDSAALKPSSPSSSCCSAAKERDQVRFRASPSSPYLTSTRLIQIEKGDGSPVLRPSATSLPPATFQAAKEDDFAVIKRSPFARSQEQAFSGASSSSSLHHRFPSTEDHNSAVLMPSSSSSARSQEQVVVLKVSLHCKGCEAKVRKHISRIKGVTTFNIDFAAKKVTVTGDVTPLGVLSSISKVKSAQFWPSPPR